MKIVNTPYTFENGRMLSPCDVNRVFDYAQECILDASGRRYRETFLPVSFEKSAGVGVSNTDSANVRSFYLQIPVGAIIWVRRAWLYFKGTCSAPVNVEVTPLSGPAPAGLTDPWLTTGGALTAERSDDFNPQPFRLNAGQLYEFKVESTGTFTSTECNLVLHILSDRWSNPPNPQTTGYTEDDFVDGSAVSAAKTAIEAESAKFAAQDFAPLPVLFQYHGFSSFTPTQNLTFSLPSHDSDRAEQRIVLATLAAVKSFGSFSSISAVVRNPSGSSILTLLSTSNSQFVYENSGAVSLTTSGSSLSPATTSDDHSVVLSNSSLTSCLKGQVVLWLSTV